MRQTLLVLLAVVASACGPGRDPSFFRVVQFSAVDKIQLADDWIYYVEGEGLKRVKKSAGMTQLVHAGIVTDFAVTSGHAFAVVGSEVAHYALASNGVISGPNIISVGEAVLAIAADRNGVSWVTCKQLIHGSTSGTNLITVPLTGTCSAGLVRLTLDSSTAYGIDGTGQWFAARTGGPVTHFANESCLQIEAAGGWLYCGNGSRGLTRLSPLRPEVEQVLDGAVHTFAIGQARIYAGVGDDLVSSPRNTAQAEVLGTYAAISAITLDETSVYFVNTEGNLGLLLRTSL